MRTLIMLVSWAVGGAILGGVVGMAIGVTIFGVMLLFKGWALKQLRS